MQINIVALIISLIGSLSAFNINVDPSFVAQSDNLQLNEVLGTLNKYDVQL